MSAGYMSRRMVTDVSSLQFCPGDSATWRQPPPAAGARRCRGGLPGIRRAFARPSSRGPAPSGAEGGWPA